MAKNTGSLASPPSTVLFGWNTASDGTGNEYGPGTSMSILTDTDLYPIWMPPAATEYLFTNGSLKDTSGGGHDLTNTFVNGIASTAPANFVQDRHGAANSNALDIPIGWSIISNPVDSLIIDDTATFSCSFWFLAKNAGYTGGAIVFLQNPDVTGFGFYSMTFYTAGSNYVENCATSHSTGNFLKDVPITYSGVQTNWIHVACVYTCTSGTSNLDIYVDGVKYTGSLTMGHISGSLPSSGVVEIGGIANGYYYSGYVDDVPFYRSALTPTQVNALHNEQLKIQSVSLRRACRSVERVAP